MEGEVSGINKKTTYYCNGNALLLSFLTPHKNLLESEIRGGGGREGREREGEDEREERGRGRLRNKTHLVLHVFQIFVK